MRSSIALSSIVLVCSLAWSAWPQAPVPLAGTKYSQTEIRQPDRYRLGIQLRETSEGMVIQSVTADGPATRLRLADDLNVKGSLEPGDRIEVLNGIPIDTMQDYDRALERARQSNGRVRMLVRDVMNGEVVEWLAQAQLVPTVERPEIAPTPQLGIQGEELADGILITELRDSSPLRKLHGVQGNQGSAEIGDILCAINGIRINNFDQLRRILERSRRDESIRITLRTGIYNRESTWEILSERTPPRPSESPTHAQPVSPQSDVPQPVYPNPDDPRNDSWNDYPRPVDSQPVNPTPIESIPQSVDPQTLDQFSLDPLAMEPRPIPNQPQPFDPQPFDPQLNSSQPNNPQSISSSPTNVDPQPNSFAQPNSVPQPTPTNIDSSTESIPSNNLPRRIHFLICGLTNDGKIGPSVDVSLNELTTVLQQQIEPQLVASFVVLKGRDCTAPSIMSMIDRLNVSPADTLFVYYIGHGAYDTNLANGDAAEGHFFQIDSGDLPRRVLYERILSKRARLSVLISDTCNVKATAQLKAPKGMGLVPHSNGGLHNLQHLLLAYRGQVDLSASSRNQFSWFNESVGGWFTHTLCQQLSKYDRWEAFLQKVSERSNDFFRESREYILAHPANSDVQTTNLIRAQQAMIPQAFHFNVSSDPQADTKQ